MEEKNNDFNEDQKNTYNSLLVEYDTSKYDEYSNYITSLEYILTNYHGAMPVVHDLCMIFKATSLCKNCNFSECDKHADIRCKDFKNCQVIDCPKKHIPLCKKNKYCTYDDCHYRHIDRYQDANTKHALVNKSMPCRFKEKCRNKELCPFLHEAQKCRYGNRCNKRMTCPFAHI